MHYGAYSHDVTVAMLVDQTQPRSQGPLSSYLEKVP